MKNKLCFETGTHPPFRLMSQNTQFLFFEGFPTGNCDTKVGDCLGKWYRQTDMLVCESQFRG